MGLFRKKTARVIRRGAAAEERTVRRVGDHEVTIRRFSEPAPNQSQRQSGQRQKGKRRPAKDRGARSPSGRHDRRSKAGRGSTKPGRTRTRREPRPDVAVVSPPDTARKQMLVRSNPHQTQIVVLEGPVLVEHYVARSDTKSLVGNVYMGKVRNVLPGMEAAFIDFGEGKNGVLYASDVNYDGAAGNGKPRRIELILKPGDSILVQVVKDAMGHKGARLTNQLSLAGRYVVLSPDPDVRGISRRLSEDERVRLRDIVSEIRPKGMGAIVRTAALGASFDDMQSDVIRLKSILEDIMGRTSTPAPALLHEEPPLVLRVIRENFTNDFRRLMVDDTETYRQVLDYLEGTETDLLSKVTLYEDDLPIFERFHVEDQLRKALDRKVWLPSGGHVVIDRTEALTVIDVNTGRFVGNSNLEETVLQNNLEAAEEIARQLRLRDIGGIIVIDFIDMEIAQNQERVLTKFREQLAKDKMRTQVFDVSNLGLVEMTRKNVSAGLLESFSEVCPHCSGRGVLLHEDAATAGTPLPNDNGPS